MASVFRKRIAYKVLSTFKQFLEGVENRQFYDALPVSLKFCQPKSYPPQFELAWKDIMKLKPSLEARVHPKSIFSYLKNQGFSSGEGIVDVCLDATKHETLVFTVDQELFTSSVLFDISRSIHNMPNISCFFRDVPPENILTEYSSPNIAKPFHYGHFRSTILGNFISNICKYVGHDVKRLNYVGDWGLQYGILAAGFNDFGSESKLKSDPLNHLYEVYVESNARSINEPEFNEKAREYFKKMEQGDINILSQWKILRDLSLEEMDKTYKRLNICFDEIHGESMYAENSKEIFNMLLKKNLATCKEDGSIESIILNEKNEEETVILRKSDGTSLYLSRDIAAAIERQRKYHFDSLYYVVDSSQSKHFSHLKGILKSMGLSWASNVHHVPFGRILNFSTRKGSAVFLHDILNEAKERTLEYMLKSPNIKVTENLEQIADILGVTGLIISDFSAKRKREIQFSWDNVLNMKGNSGVSLQYCHARLYSIKQNCGCTLSTDCELSPLVEEEVISLVSHLSKFDEVIYNTYIHLEPCILVHYLFILRQEIGRAIKKLPVKNCNPYTAKARLLLFHCSQEVLRKSMKLLGITPLNQV